MEETDIKITLRQGNGYEIEFDKENGDINYYDSDGNNFQRFSVKDKDYEVTKKMYFPNAKINPNQDED